RQAEAQKETVLRQWEELWGFLEEQKRLLVGWLDRLAQDIAQREEEEEKSLSGAPVETPLPCKRGGETVQWWRSGRALQCAANPRNGEDAPFLKPGGDDFVELEQRLGCFLGKRAILQKVLSDFQESLWLEVQKLIGSRTCSFGGSRVFLPLKWPRTETDAAKPLQVGALSLLLWVLTVTELEMASWLDDAEESGVKGLPVSEGRSRRSPPPPGSAEWASEKEERDLQPQNPEQAASPRPLLGSGSVVVLLPPVAELSILGDSGLLHNMRTL
ncbi:hypothetical protein lerEdw1_015989, partial [Lerista edwardsae]